MSPPEVTLLIPHYKTLDITRLCLRLIRKHTDPERIRVLVIDNASGDESTDYLRALTWITLLERRPEPDDTPSLSHARALDLALRQVDTPYVLSFHTDTLVRQAGWLDCLLAPIRQDPAVAGVGSWKLERKPLYRQWAKRLESRAQAAWYGLTGRDRSRLEGSVDHERYLRSHCALYRTEPLRRFRLTFAADRDTAGKILHRRLAREGYRMIFLPSDILGRYIVHLNHATMVLNPALGARPKSIAQGRRRLRKLLAEIQAEQVLQEQEHP